MSFFTNHEINFLARHAGGDHLVFLNDDTKVINSEWLCAMLEFSQQKDIGVVEAKLYYPDGRLQHVGAVCGICGSASHVFSDAPREYTGYFGSAQTIRNYSAVTFACAMSRRAVFDELQGLDERFAIDFNDVDYCLRALESGYRVVFTPFSQLYHHESVSIGSRTIKPPRNDFHLLRERWMKYIDNNPYYNPNLTRNELNYEVRT